MDITTRLEGLVEAIESVKSDLPLGMHRALDDIADEAREALELAESEGRGYAEPDEDLFRDDERLLVRERPSRADDQQVAKEGAPAPSGV